MVHDGILENQNYLAKSKGVTKDLFHFQSITEGSWGKNP